MMESEQRETRITYYTVTGVVSKEKACNTCLGREQEESSQVCIPCLSKSPRSSFLGNT
jgi:hypothetical protein